MTLTVLGLDAADLRLAREFDCENLLLDRQAKLESFTHARETPLTAEVWPVIASGRMPTDEGEGGKRGSDWSGAMGVLDRLSKLVVPQSWRSDVGRYLRVGKPGEAMFGDDDGDHAFSEGAAFNWPGLTPTRSWKRAEYWLERYHAGDVDDYGFLRRQLAFTGQEVGWLASMSQAGLPIVGAHLHILDHAGHAWARQPEKLRETYEHVDRLAGTLRAHDAVSELVIVSDHGMQTTVTDDGKTGHHHIEGMVASTFDGHLPGHVSDVRGWLETNTPEAEPVGQPWDEGSFDTPTEHLKELGYID
jgi:hypothetical protein